MRKSSAVRLTIVAAIGMAAHAQSRLEPCASSTFNEAACEAAVKDNGYCWNGKWVRLQYHYPFPYYYDSYYQFLGQGGVPYPMATGNCRAPHGAAAHGVSRAGFGHSGASAHC
jgi:hypothetical protein